MDTESAFLLKTFVSLNEISLILLAAKVGLYPNTLVNSSTLYGSLADETKEGS